MAREFNDNSRHHGSGLCVKVRLSHYNRKETSDNQKEKDKWDISNHLCLMIIKKAILEAFRGAISDSIVNAALCLSIHCLVRQQ